jgi:hypothetical protein
MARFKDFDEDQAIDSAVEWARSYEATSVRDLADTWTSARAFTPPTAASALFTKALERYANARCVSASPASRRGIGPRRRSALSSQRNIEAARTVSHVPRNIDAEAVSGHLLSIRVLARTEARRKLLEGIALCQSSRGHRGRQKVAVRTDCGKRRRALII